MNTRERSILLAAMLVTLVTGSIHAYSVFLIPLEALLQSSRASISLIYSGALIFLTVTVLFGYRVYAAAKPSSLIILACTAAGSGLIVSAFATSWWVLFLGYSVLFGSANGIAYGYVLQLVGRALPQNKGMAMASVTAAYAVGSVLFSLILANLVERVSLTSAFIIMGAIIVISGLVAGFIMSRQNVAYSNTATVQAQTHHSKLSSVVLLWLAYGCAVFAGLMAIGHAAGMVQSFGGSYGLSVWGAVFIGVGSAVGGFLSGAKLDARNMNRYLILLPGISAVSLAALAMVSQPVIAIAVLSVVGFAYGALIAVYPFAISEFFGDQQGPKVYGQVFTAWGAAGLAGPWFAGKLYDQSGNYVVPLALACVIAIASSVIYFMASKRFSD